MAPSTHALIALLISRLQVALAVIAALRAALRAVAVGLELIARARFLAARALHQHAAALAVGNQSIPARSLERLLGGRCLAILGALIRHRPREFRAGKGCDLFAELLAQHAGLDFL